MPKHAPLQNRRQTLSPDSEKSNNSPIRQTSNNQRQRDKGSNARQIPASTSVVPWPPCSRGGGPRPGKRLARPEQDGKIGIDGSQLWLSVSLSPLRFSDFDVKFISHIVYYLHMNRHRIRRIRGSAAHEARQGNGSPTCKNPATIAPNINQSCPSASDSQPPRLSSEPHVTHRLALDMTRQPHMHDSPQAPCRPGQAQAERRKKDWRGGQDGGRGFLGDQPAWFPEFDT
ncbi:hypothetical protein J3F83DRAFT_755137 [Trichoderma novae-zelandiae]